MDNNKLSQASPCPHAKEASRLFGIMAHDLRLEILCCLRERPHGVSELIDRLQQRQAFVSQHLAILRASGLVEPTRNGRSITYRLADDRVPGVIAVVLASPLTLPRLGENSPGSVVAGD